MISLNEGQRDLLLDYCFGCASEENMEAARKLLSSNSGAVEFCEKLQHSLSLLEHLHSESCPEHLVENTIDRLQRHHAALSGHGRLTELLDAEQSRIVTARPSFWRNFSEVITTAAAILIVAAVFFPVTTNMRNKARLMQCSANLSGIGQSISRYANDNGNVLPAVATVAGDPWWKVGAKGKQNQSNTRHLWLLVKEKYAEPNQFTCPGRRCNKRPSLDRNTIAELNDFPSRKYVGYSFRLITSQSGRILAGRSVPIMADTNPIFEGCTNRQKCYEYREFSPVKLRAKLLKANSKNHRGKGQNVMFSDGSVRFMKNRIAGELNDDIFTIKGTQIYRGVESPNSATDIFLVP